VRAAHEHHVGVDLLEPYNVLVYVTLQRQHTNAGHFLLPSSFGETNLERRGLGPAHRCS